MKTTLSIEESTRLIELGVDPKLASKRTPGIQIPTDDPNIYYKVKEGDTVFTLSDLLSILPKEILLGNRLYCNLKIQYIYEEWAVNYSPHAMSIFRAPELIDSLYQLLIWCLEQGYCKCGKGGGR